MNKTKFVFLFFGICLSFFSLTVCAQKVGTYQTINVESSSELQNIVDSAVKQTLENFAESGLKPENLAATIIDLNNPDHPVAGNFRGDEKIYPASVVKLFYLAATHQWLENGIIKDSPELRRTMHEMIVVSSNDATQSIVDTLSGVGAGGEMTEKEFKKWAYKRNAVNRYFKSLKFQNINVCQKTFCEDAFGVEQQFRGKDGVNRNKLTTNATARLMAEIALRKVVTANRSEQMLELLKRDWRGDSTDKDDQAHGFTGITLKELGLADVKLWSKAGWTSTTRHDVAYLEFPSGKKYVICVFTEKFANERNIIPSIEKLILGELSK